MARSESEPKSEPAVVRYIKQLGPMTGAESMFDVANKQRRFKADVRKYEALDALYPESSKTNNSDGFCVGVTHQPIVFHDDHELDEVIECWLEANPQIERHSSSWAIYQGLLQVRHDDDPLLDVAKEVLRRRDPDGWC